MFSPDMLKANSIILLVIVIFIKGIKSGHVGRNDDLTIVTEVGTIRGLHADNGDYRMFMGIPYANVNESNVFGDPIPHPPFENEFEAYDDSAICPQVEEFNFTTVGTLDCLHLNIYVPNSASSDTPLPVMVYIYGGGFYIGFAGRFLLGPKYLVRHDVILVTLNYRIGPYGFMCLDTPEVPGNAGLKDQVLALRWIKNNIRSFGGDPDQVTVFGNSAGGMSIALHMVSENEMLFSNAILQSGSGYYTGITSGTNPDALLRLAAQLNYETQDYNDAIFFLSNADVLSVIDAANAAGLSFMPCVEKEFPGVDRFLSEAPINSKHTKIQGTGVMLGYNSEELLAMYPEGASLEGMQLDALFRGTLNNAFNFEEQQLIQLSNIVRRFYIGDKDTNDDVREQLLHFSSDSSFVYSTIRSIEPYLEAGVDKIYQYVFSHDGEKNFVKYKNGITAPGVAHADEIGYLFNMVYIPGEPNEEDQLIIDRMTTMWANFAKYRDPTPQTSVLLPVKWEPITRGSPYHYVDINVNMTSGARYEARRMTFWDLLYKSYGNYERGLIIETEVDQVDPEDSEPDSSTLVCFSPILGLIVIINIFASFHY